MRVRYIAVMLILFSAAVFALPLTALPMAGEDVEYDRAASTGSGSETMGEASPWWPSTGYEEEPSIYTAQDEPLAQAEQPAQNVATPLSVPADMSFRYYDISEGRVKNISALDYVRGALAVEMPASFHMEALKAQAISAHTYALYRAANTTADGVHFESDPKKREGFITEAQAKEFFGDNAEFYWGRICEAVDAAFDYVMVYEGEPILAAYHASSVGITEAAENVWQRPLPYLVPVESEGDPLSPGYNSSVSMTADALRSAINLSFEGANLSNDPSEWLEPLEYSPSGYMTLARVGDLTVRGSELRSALELRSSALEIAYSDGIFNFTTTGYGHGVGLSQYGADYMARQGSTFDEILMHYYPGASLIMLTYQR